MPEVTSETYDRNILDEGLEFQVNKFYQPVDPVMARRIAVVLGYLSPLPGEKVLDVGCGSGAFSFNSAKLGSSVVGCDYSAESVKAADILCRRFGAGDNTRFIRANAVALPFKAECFDKIIAADFVEHITEKEKESFLAESWRVLRPGGKLVAFTPNKIREDIGGIYWKLRHLLFGHNIPHTDLHYGLITAGRFSRMSVLSGFKCKIYYDDVVRGYLAHIPVLKLALALNLIIVLEKRLI